jgi:ATP-dependent helicase/DNAse subunit B
MLYIENRRMLLRKGECLLYIIPSRMAWEKENAMLYIQNRRMLLRKRRMPIIYSPSWMTWGKENAFFP